MAETDEMAGRSGGLAVASDGGERTHCKTDLLERTQPRQASDGISVTPAVRTAANKSDMHTHDCSTPDRCLPQVGPHPLEAMAQPSGSVDVSGSHWTRTQISELECLRADLVTFGRALDSVTHRWSAAAATDVAEVLRLRRALADATAALEEKEKEQIRKTEQAQARRSCDAEVADVAEFTQAGELSTADFILQAAKTSGQDDTDDDELLQEALLLFGRCFEHQDNPSKQMACGITCDMHDRSNQAQPQNSDDLSPVQGLGDGNHTYNGPALKLESANDQSKKTSPVSSDTSDQLLQEALTIFGGFFRTPEESPSATERMADAASTQSDTDTDTECVKTNALGQCFSCHFPDGSEKQSSSHASDARNEAEDEEEDLLREALLLFGGSYGATGAHNQEECNMPEQSPSITSPSCASIEEALHSPAQTASSPAASEASDELLQEARSIFGAFFRRPRFATLETYHQNGLRILLDILQPSEGVKVISMSFINESDQDYLDFVCHVSVPVGFSAEMGLPSSDCILVDAPLLQQEVRIRHHMTTLHSNSEQLQMRLQIKYTRDGCQMCLETEVSDLPQLSCRSGCGHARIKDGI